MIFLITLFLLSQDTKNNEQKIDEEVIKGKAELKIQDQKIYLFPKFKIMAPLDTMLAGTRYIFDENLYATIDSLNTPILKLHSAYLRAPMISKLMYGTIALFVPRFERTIASWDLVITNTNGEVIRRYADRGTPPSALAWDGRTDNGEMCNVGEIYNYVFTAFDAVGNPTRITGQPYQFNGLVYDEGERKIIAVAADVLFDKNASSLTMAAAGYLDEISNYIKEHFKNEVVVFSYSENESWATARGEIIMNEIIKRNVLPKGTLKTAPRFIPGLTPKYSKIEIIIQ